jgi:hypothetical protein
MVELMLARWCDVSRPKVIGYSNLQPGAWIPVVDFQSINPQLPDNLFKRCLNLFCANLALYVTLPVLFSEQCLYRPDSSIIKENQRPLGL